MRRVGKTTKLSKRRRWMRCDEIDAAVSKWTKRTMRRMGGGVE